MSKIEEKYEKYRQMVRTAITEALNADGETIYKMEYDFSDKTLKDHKKYVVTPYYAEVDLVEQKMIEALYEIDKAREIEYAVMQAKIEAYELALGKFPEPKITKEEVKNE